MRKVRQFLFSLDPTPSIWWYTAYARTKARFIRTYLGSLWIGISNLLAVSAIGVVYRYVFSVQDFPYYFAYLALGITIWSFISGSALSCAGLFQASRERSLNSDFTPSFFFLEEYSFQVLSFFQAAMPILVVLLISGLVKPVGLVVGIVPALNLCLVVFMLSALLALIGAKYKDIGMLFPVIFQLMFLTSPIMFFKESAGQAYVFSYYNPIYRSLNAVRSAVVDGNASIALHLAIMPVLLVGCYLSYRCLVILRNRIILWY